MKIPGFAVWDNRQNRCISVRFHQLDASILLLQCLHSLSTAGECWHKANEVIRILEPVAMDDSTADRLLVRHNQLMNDYSPIRDPYALKNLIAMMWMHAWERNYVTPPYIVVSAMIDVDIGQEEDVEIIEKVDEHRSIII